MCLSGVVPALHAWEALILFDDILQNGSECYWANEINTANLFFIN